MKKMILLLALGAPLVLIRASAAPAAAEENPNVVKLAPTVTVAAAVEKLAAATKALVAVDPTIDEKVPASFAEGTLETGLKRIADLRRLQYRKLYVDPAAMPKIANQGLDVAKLRVWAMALDALASGSVGLDRGSVLTVATSGATTSPEMQAWLKGRTAVHVLYRPEGQVARARSPQGLPRGAEMPKPIDATGMSPQQVAEAFKSGKPVAMDFQTARKLRELYPGLLPDIKMDMPEGANGRIVLMRRDGEGGGERRLEIRADALELHEAPQ